MLYIERSKTMANIKFIREYKLFPESSETWYDILYAKSNRLCTYTADDLPKTARVWLKNKVGTTIYDSLLEREEVIYKDEPAFRVEFDFRVNGKDVHDYLDNNGKGFCKEDAVHVGKQLVAQGNTHVTVIAI